MRYIKSYYFIEHGERLRCLLRYAKDKYDNKTDFTNFLQQFYVVHPKCIYIAQRCRKLSLVGGAEGLSE